jgi:hypothetical protein
MVVLGTAAILAQWDVNAVLAQETIEPLINEFMASNTQTLADEDGDFPDWLELFNPGEDLIDLTSYGLSDDPNDPFKWVFPHGVLHPGTPRLVYASDKDRRDVPDHWETILAAGDTWRYFIGLEAPPIDWHTPGFDDAAWLSGPSRFGYRDGDATVLPRKSSPTTPNQTSFFLRASFEVADPNAVLAAFLHLAYEDAFVAYLNGREIARAHIGTPGSPPLYNEVAEEVASKDAEAFPVKDLQDLLLVGKNTLAIQVHSASPVHHLSALPLLTLGLTKAPAIARGTPDFIELPAVFHTNFKIKASGEILQLTNPAGKIVDQVEREQIPTDFSWGRAPDGGPEWHIFSTPTPGAANSTEGLVDFTAGVTLSPPGGFYRNGTSVTLSTDTPQAQIYYTLDGAVPADSVTMFLYDDPISIDSTTVVNARAFAPGLLPGKASTHTYLVGRDFELGVMSLSTHPDHLFDDKIGIYVEGTNDNYENKRYNANYGEDWERPIHMEFFEPDGTLGFSVDGGVKIIGLAGRTYPRKGMALFMRSRYGASQIDYQIFPDLPIDKFSALVLRNSGRDIVEHSTLFRDELCQALVADLDVDLQAYRPVIVYLNGTYWGIHNLREKQNEEYLAAHHGVDPNNVDILELYHRSPPPIVIEGDAEHYNDMIDFMNSNDMADAENYNYVKTQMYMDHYISYIAAEIYLGNIDWLGNNMKFWRPKTPDSKWRWMVFDIDWGLGRAPDGVRHNTLEMALDPEGPRSYPAWTTLLNRRLFVNQDFINTYVNRSADFLNTLFLPERIAQTIDALKTVLEPELQHHFARWGGDVPNWERNLREQATYAVERPFFLRKFIMERFALEDTVEVKLNVSQPGAGRIAINTLDIDALPWHGIYFQGVPISVSALPAPGFRFSSWSGALSSDQASTTLLLEGDASLTAHFVSNDEALNRIVINEINYNSADDFDPGDWVELHSSYEVPVDVSGWVFNDDNDTLPFVIPGETVIKPGDFLVLCRDSIRFRRAFPNAEGCIGNFGFRLSSGSDQVRLYDNDGTLVDSLTYNEGNAWPTTPDGGGATLALLNPALDNALAQSWGASMAHGTPGLNNEIITVIDVATDDTLPASFALEQNYPNPFNPITTIRFALPRAGRVRVDLYSSLGQRVATLVDTDLSAGSHRIIFNATHLASGLYFYTMRTPTFEQTRRMTLLK